jgi:hypothetical protein
MTVRHIQFFVCMKVVGRSNSGDHKVETVFPQPDDFFLATYATMVLAVSAWALTNSKAILDDPSEIARGDPQCPFSAKLRGHSVLLLIWS